MKTFFQLVRVLLGLSLLVGGPVGAAVLEDCNAFYVNGKESENPGKCTSFQDCPFLFDLIKSPHLTAQEIILLQDLTCKRDNTDPLVCCAVADILPTTQNNSLANFEIKAPSTTINHNEDVIIFQPQKDINIKRPAPAKPSDIREDNVNFRLLPTLNECGSWASGDRILGGQTGSILDFPWLARIGYESQEDGTIKFLCAGTIINKRYILTAAHCTEEVNRDDYIPVVVRIAERDEECDPIFQCSEPLDIKIEKIIPHPKYSKRDKSNDVGLIRLEEEIKYDVFTRPVCLPFVEEYGLDKSDVDPSLENYFGNVNKSAVVAGWGKTRWNAQEGSSYLQYVNLPVISPEGCRKNYEHHPRVIITDKQLCAGGEKGKDSCGGDSGGGLFLRQGVPTATKFKHKRNLTFQYGVVSFGPTRCGIGDLPGVYTNVYAYKKWILDQLKP